MTAFLRIRPEGRWLTGTTIKSDELEDIDGNLYNAFNGDEGGAWNPTTRLVVGGAGWRCATDCDIDDARAITMSGESLISFVGGKLVERYVDISLGYAQEFPTVVDAAGWMRGADGSTRTLWFSSALGAPLVIPIRAPRLSQIEQIKVTLGYEGPTHAAGPEQTSLVEIVRGQIGDDPRYTSFGSARDAFIDVASYEAVHNVTLALDVPLPVEDGYRYGLRLTAEAGANAHILQTLIAMQVSARVFDLDPHVS